jgi:nitroreductase
MTPDPSAFQTPIVELIPRRQSWRAYEARAIPPETKVRIARALEAPPRPPFGSEVRARLIELEGYQQEGGRKLGTYGIIRGAKYFLVGGVRQGDQCLEDFGYVFEWLVLLATDLGLATCWVGGTFQRDRFGQALGVGPDEVVPAISPVGFARPKRSVVDRMARWAASSKKRKPWSELFFEGSFDTPLEETTVGSYATVLEMVRLGPSASNKQPWRIVRESRPQDERFHLFLQRTKGYQGNFAVDLQRIDMGIAICHFALTARELGLTGGWEIHGPLTDFSLPDHTSYVATWVSG